MFFNLIPVAGFDFHINTTTFSANQTNIATFITATTTASTSTTATTTSTFIIPTSRMKRRMSYDFTLSHRITLSLIWPVFESQVSYCYLKFALMISLLQC